MLVWISPCVTAGIFLVYRGKVFMWIAFGVFMVNFAESKENAFVSHCLIFLNSEYCKILSVIVSFITKVRAETLSLNGSH